MSVDLNLLQTELAETFQTNAFKKGLQADLDDSAENRYFGEFNRRVENVDTLRE